ARHQHLPASHSAALAAHILLLDSSYSQLGSVLADFSVRYRGIHSPPHPHEFRFRGFLSHSEIRFGGLHSTGRDSLQALILSPRRRLACVWRLPLGAPGALEPAPVLSPQCYLRSPWAG